MKRLNHFISALLLVTSLWPSVTVAQAPPATMPPSSVYGRLGAGQPGPGQAIPFAVLTAQLAGNGSFPAASFNSVWPTFSGVNQGAEFARTDNNFAWGGDAWVWQGQSTNMTYFTGQPIGMTLASTSYEVRSQTNELLTAPASAGATSLSVSAATGILVGQRIAVSDGVTNTTVSLSYVTAINSLTLTIFPGLTNAAANGALVTTSSVSKVLSTWSGGTTIAVENVASNVGSGDPARIQQGSGLVAIGTIQSIAGTNCQQGNYQGPCTVTFTESVSGSAAIGNWVGFGTSDVTPQFVLSRQGVNWAGFTGDWGPAIAFAMPDSAGNIAAVSVYEILGNAADNSLTTGLDISLTNSGSGFIHSFNGSTFSTGIVALQGSSSGTTTLAATSTGGGAITFPAVTGTATILGNSSTGSGAVVLQTSPSINGPLFGLVSSINFQLAGSSSGVTNFESANAGASNYIVTVPAATGTMTLLGNSTTGSGNIVLSSSPSIIGPSFAQSGGTNFVLAGSSSGVTNFQSANAGASNFTITIPATTGTVALTGSTVASFSAGSTGFTPNSATTGAVTLAGTLGAASGGTGEANNAANTISFSGNFGLTLTLSNTTSLTLPTSGTVATQSSGTFVATPTGLTVVGTPTYTGQYVKTGLSVFMTITASSTTSIAGTGGGWFFNLPFAALVPTGAANSAGTSVCQTQDTTIGGNVSAGGPGGGLISGGNYYGPTISVTTDVLVFTCNYRSAT